MGDINERRGTGDERRGDGVTFNFRENFLFFASFTLRIIHFQKTEHMQKTKIIALLFGALFLFSFVNAQQNMDSLSYSLGVLLAQNLKSQGFDKIDDASFHEAFNAVMAGKELAIDAQQANSVIQQYMMEQQKAKEAEQAKEYESVIAEGQAFLEKNGKREGVVTLPSGLEYEVLVPGDGPKPTAKDKVTVHYHGTLMDGTVFDSSVERGQPATFGVSQVIKGWTEALQLMPQGSKWKLYIPYDLAYGSHSAGPTIGPYSTLVFEVELLKVN